MKAKLLYSMAILPMLLTSLSSVLGCMYNVRDAGFVDIGSIPYRLNYYVRNDTPAELTSAFRQISYAALMDSNVVAKMISVDQHENSPDEADAEYQQAMKYLDFWEVKSFPAAIMVSPKGRSLALPVSGKTNKESLWSLLESAVLSPKREEITSSIVEAYCVVLLIQGKDDAENKEAQRKVTDAIEEIGRLLNQMTRPIKKPPRLIVVPPELFSQERILLWSLGVNGAEVDVPCVAVVYGRGRWIGPLLEGEAIAVNRMFNILSVIGESCECGIDKGWIMGTMLPLRWGEKTQSEVVKSLGFDAESPMVKTEISQILSLNPSLEADKPSENIFQGYSEMAVEPESSTTVAAVSPAQLRQLVSRRPDASDTGDHGRHPYRVALCIIGGMVLLILVGGLLIILRERLVEHRGQT
jgi:hypothetical protein